MTSDATRVVVTGLGATTPLGGDVATTWAGLLAGNSGVVLLTQDWAESLPVRLAAPVAVDPSEVMDRVEARTLDRSAQLALVAAREAWADAGFTVGDGQVDPMRLGAVVASGIGGVTTLLQQYDVLKEKGARRVSPYTVPMLMPNGPAANVSLAIGARAGTHTPVSACASGAEAIAYGIEMIRTGRADVVAAGGTEAAIHALPMAAFAAMRALSTREDDPQGASRPYDKSRDGFVLGEGAGILILESEEHAKARGARIYGYASGFGLSSDAHHIAAPDPTGEGAARAMTDCIANSDASPEDVVHVNAHATSTPAGDVAESQAMYVTLGERAGSVPVTATKGNIGHLLGAAGSVASIVTLLSLKEGLIPPTRNLTDQDDQIPLDVVTVDPRPVGEGLALVNAFGFGGHNVCLGYRTY
ncbi:MAG: 3-oxoacyl-(acyl-carrier-protein) synthase 2 [Frankiales bacterium]|nr:3-oxoacyl-(acyl-carrier-protein) synthase 2 [Frankiales bacterium]